MTPLPESILDDIRDCHSRVAKHYGSSDLTGQVPGPSLAAWNFQRHVIEPLEYFTSTYQLTAEDILLDAGCGNGQFTQVYARLTPAHLWGVDISPEMLEVSRERAEAGGYSQRYKGELGDVQNLASVPSESVSFVHFAGVIEHLDDPRQALKELVRVTRPGGHLLIIFPRAWSGSHLSYTVFGQAPLYWGQPRHWAERVRWRERLHYYRFFSVAFMKECLQDLPVELLERSPVAASFLLGPTAGLIDRLLRRKVLGYGFLDWLETWARRAVPPGGEYWLLRK